MRIALLNSLFPELGIGGSEISTYFLAKGLKSLGHSVHVFSENNSNETVTTSYDGIAVTRVGALPGYQPNIFAEPRLEMDYWKNVNRPHASVFERISPYILEFRPNIIHTSVIGGTTGFWNLAKSCGIPAIHTLRSYSLLCHRRMLRGNNACERMCAGCLTDGRKNSRNQSEKVTGVVAISNHVMDVFRGAGWFANVKNRQVIANSYEPKETDIYVDKSTKYFDFGYIGRLHETKGIAELLGAFEKFNRGRRVQAKLLIAGDGNDQYVRTLEARYSTENVTYAGFMNTSEFFKQVRFCVVPSVWYEPFGRVFVESLHHGVPVIGSKRGGGAEVLDGNTGWLFDPGSVDEFTAALEGAYETSTSKYQLMNASCLENAKQYTVEAIARKYAAFYETCLGV